MASALKHWPPSSLSLADEHNLSFQIHERLQHYEESKPVPVQDNAASLGHEVSFFFFLQGRLAIIWLHLQMGDQGKKKRAS